MATAPKRTNKTLNEKIQEAVAKGGYLKISLDKGGRLKTSVVKLSGAEAYWSDVPSQGATSKRDPAMIYLPDLRLAGHMEHIQFYLFDGTNSRYTEIDWNRFQGSVRNAYTKQNHKQNQGYLSELAQYEAVLERTPAAPKTTVDFGLLVALAQALEQQAKNPTTTYVQINSSKGPVRPLGSKATGTRARGGKKAAGHAGAYDTRAVLAKVTNPNTEYVNVNKTQKGGTSTVTTKKAIPGTAIRLSRDPNDPLYRAAYSSRSKTGQEGATNFIAHHIAGAGVAPTAEHYQQARNYVASLSSTSPARGGRLVFTPGKVGGVSPLARPQGASPTLQGVSPMATLQPMGLEMAPVRRLSSPTATPGRTSPTLLQPMQPLVAPGGLGMQTQFGMPPQFGMGQIAAPAGQYPQLTGYTQLGLGAQQGFPAQQGLPVLQAPGARTSASSLPPFGVPPM